MSCFSSLEKETINPMFFWISPSDGMTIMGGLGLDGLGFELVTTFALLFDLVTAGVGGLGLVNAEVEAEGTD